MLKDCFLWCSSTARKRKNTHTHTNIYIYIYTHCNIEAILHECQFCIRTFQCLVDEHSSNMPVLLLRQAQHNMIQKTETALSRGWHPASLMEKGHGTIVAEQQEADALEGLRVKLFTEFLVNNSLRPKCLWC